MSRAGGLKRSWELEGPSPQAPLRVMNLSARVARCPSSARRDRRGPKLGAVPTRFLRIPWPALSFRVIKSVSTPSRYGFRYYLLLVSGSTPFSLANQASSLLFGLQLAFPTCPTPETHLSFARYRSARHPAIFRLGVRAWAALSELRPTYRLSAQDVSVCIGVCSRRRKNFGGLT